MVPSNQRIKLGPILRFPDFHDNWSQKTLASLTKIYDGTHQTPNYVAEGIPFYSVEQVTANDFEKTKYISKEVFEKESKRIKIEKGDLLMTRIGDIGTVQLVDWEPNASFYVSLALIKKTNSANSSFLAQYMKTSGFQHELWKRTIHVAFPRKINLGEIGNCHLFLPRMTEQQKIAKFLTAIDSWIKNLHSQKEKLENYKKGLVQKIFSQRIRFKDKNSEYYPKWKQIPLKEICKKESSTLAYSQILGGKGKYLVYGANGIAGSHKSYQNDSECIAIVKDGAGVGRLIYCKPKSSVLSTLDILQPKKVNIHFLWYLLAIIQFDKYVTGSTIPHIYFRDYSKEKVSLPSPEEQKRIADFLTSIDNLIKSKTTKIKKAEEWKKGLLQKMFV